MSRYILWLECLTMEETFLFTYACIAALGVVFAVVAWNINKRIHDEKKDS